MHAAREDSHVRQLEDLIGKFNLIITNDETATWVGAHNSRSIIDLTLLAGVKLVSWTVKTNQQTGSDHELIAFKVAPHDGQFLKTEAQSVTGWDIQGMTKKKALQAAATSWEAEQQGQPHLEDGVEVEQIERKAR